MTRQGIDYNKYDQKYSRKKDKVQGCTRDGRQKPTQFFDGRRHFCDDVSNLSILVRPTGHSIRTGFLWA